MTIPSIVADEVIQSDLTLLGTGALAPLRGFMSQADYKSVLDKMRLVDGTLWSIPICLPLSKEVAEAAKKGGRLEVRTAAGALLAVVGLEEIYEADRKVEAQVVFGTTEARHPGVKRLEALPPFYGAGPILEFHAEHLRLPMNCLTPQQTRKMFAERGWKTVTGFQTRNPIHRAHEHLLRLALERTDGVMIHPLVGATREEDVPAPVRVQCYDALVKNYLPEKRVILTGMPGAMRYAGPKEALLHAIIRRNHGCTHFVVGRDHAGVGGYYQAFAAQELLKSLPPKELGIQPLFFEEAFWCRRCGGMQSGRTCGHAAEDRLTFSGTFIRGQIQKGGEIPPECSRPEVIEILRREWGPKAAAGAGARS